MNTPVFKEGEALFGKVDVAELPVGAQIRLEYEIPELYLYYRAALRVSETEWAVSGRGTGTLRTAPTSEVLEMVEEPEVTRIILDRLPEQASKKQSEAAQLEATGYLNNVLLDPILSKICRDLIVCLANTIMDRGAISPDERERLNEAVLAFEANEGLCSLSMERMKCLLGGQRVCVRIESESGQVVTGFHEIGHGGVSSQRFAGFDRTRDEAGETRRSPKGPSVAAASFSQRRAVAAALQGLYLRLGEAQSYEGTATRLGNLRPGSREIEAHAQAVQDWAREQYISESLDAIEDTLAELSQLGEDGDLA